jgi:hypothetical protein
VRLKIHSGVQYETLRFHWNFGFPQRKKKKQKERNKERNKGLWKLTLLMEILKDRISTAA